MQELISKIVEFRESRNWKQFHNAKDLAISLSLEASELLELFQWKDSETVLIEKYQELQDEIADIFYYVLLISHDAGFDLEKALLNKLKQNDKKYPIEKSFGSNKKYNEF